METKRIKKLRKQYLIDRKFQLRTAFSVLSVVTLISAAVIAAISLIVLYNNSRIQNISVIEDNIVHYLTSITSAEQEEAHGEAIKQIAINHSDNMEAMSNMIETNRILIFAMIFAIAAQALILFMMMIRKTHRISGPLFVITRHMEEIRDGRYPNLRPLRESDELRTFYHVFGQMVAALKERDTARKE